MKKLNKLFAILFAMLGISTTAKADTSILLESDGWQKITALPSNLGDYYYVFVDDGSDLMMTLGAGVEQGSSYKTMWYQASSNPAEDLNKVWTLEENTSITNGVSIRNVDYDHLCLQTENNAAWHFRTHDNGGTNTGVNVSWTAFTLAYTSGKWTLQNGKYPDTGCLGAWHNTIQANAEVACNKGGSHGGTKGYFQIYAISKSDFHKLYVNANTTEGEEVNLDLSVFVGNPKIEGKGALWSSTTGCGCNYTTNKQDGTTGGFLENWSQSGPVGKIYQTITDLPNGVYELKMKAFRNNNLTGGDAVYVFANSNQTQVTTDDATTYYTVRTTLTNGTLELGLRQDKAGSQWIGLDEVSLTYLGVDLSELTAVVQATYDKLNGLSKDAIPTAFADEMTALLNKYNTLPETEAGLNSANGEMEAIIAAHPSIVAAYAPLNELITLCSTYVTESYSNVQEEAQRTAFTTAITAASSNGNKATTVAELTEVYNTLETARQTFVLAAYPTSGKSFDMTFKITNPSFETGDLTGWTIVQPSSDTGVKPNSNATYATTGVDGKYLFNTYWQGVPIKQTLAELPTGTYTLTVAVASDGCTVYLTADDEHSEGQMTSDKTQFIDTSIEFLCTDGETTIGVVGGADGDAAAHKEFTENGYWWYKADNFRLTRAFDASTLQNSLSSLKATAAELLTELMEPGKKSNLQAAHDNADTTSDNPFDLGDWSLALEKAIAEARSSINDYAKIQEYINKTKVFVDESEVATYQTKHDKCEYTAADVENVRQELNVMRFDAASLVFPNKVDVADWTGDLANGIRSDQHWSGNTQDYYDANSWTANFVGLKHTLSTTITLPNGAYVLKAAGRSSSDATLRLTIKNGDTVLESVEYTGKGDTGYGITINGCASFSADSTYANNDAGRGWEWEFAKFELDAETTVTLHVEVDYNNIQNRFGSFSDITLWMDDATYVTVYGKELDAPLAEAKTLVNTLPMGTDENTALANAIAVGEGELSGPAALNAAVDGLKTAVVNANTWRNTYYTEKDKLVAALERFETDLNDGANGALRFIVEWDELLTAVAEAACAKDVLNEHTGLTTAAATLNTVMDAVFEDYLKYEMLEDYTSVIANADCASNDAWPGSGRDNDTKEHWSGTEKTYFKQNHENGAARTQTVTLPKSGTYLLKAAVRAVEAASYVDIIINGKSHKIMGAHGRTGGTIATDGTEWESVAAGIEAGKTFANGNKGYGWVYQYIYFDAEVGENTIAISLSNYNNNREANVGGMTLYYLRPNYTEEENNVVKHYGEYNEFVVTTTTHDITAATMSNISVDFTANPNALIFANEGQVSNESNVIINGTANQLSLTDGYAFNATTDFTANAASYGREFTKDTWLTVCLPFAYTIPEGVKVETLGAIDLDTKTFTFDEVKDEMEANKPYIIKNNTEAAALLATLNDVAVKATPAKMDVTITAGNSTHKGEFIGTYTTVSTDDLMEEGAYDILFFGTDGQLYYLSSGTTTKVVTINPFRAYIRLPKDAINWSDGQKARVRHRTSESTDIEDSQSADHDSGLIYDLQGRRVLNPTKGMYIVNGEKVLF